MKTKQLYTLLPLSLATAATAVAQGTFQNLDFESATPAQFAGFVSAVNAIPDWTAEIAGLQQTEILQNEFTTGAAAVALLTPTSPQPPLEGECSVLLTGSFLGSASISQTGLIPVGAQSLSFDAQAGLSSDSLALLVGNQSISFQPVASFSTYIRYSANISAWSGQTEQLTFSALQDTSRLNIWEIDAISFYPSTIPEPDPLTLMSVGGLLFGLYCRITKKLR